MLYIYFLNNHFPLIKNITGLGERAWPLSSRPLGLFPSGLMLGLTCWWIFLFFFILFFFFGELKKNYHDYLFFNFNIILKYYYKFLFEFKIINMNILYFSFYYIYNFFFSFQSHKNMSFYFDIFFLTWFNNYKIFF